jgi:Tfp pilus assembly protein PilF
MFHFNLELMSREATIPLARSLLMRATTIDEGDGNAHSALAYLMISFERDASGAKDHIERALELFPGDARVLRRANAVFTLQGNYDRALELGLRSVELDPMNPSGFHNLCIVQLQRAEYSAAIQFGQRAIDLSPGVNGTRMIMGMAAVKLKDIALAGELAAAEPNEACKLILQCFVSIEAGAFDERTFNTLCSEHGEHWPYHVALVYAHRRYVEDAFEWLYKAVELRDGSVGQAVDDPFLTHLHTDPRWPEFLEKLSA